MLTKKTVMIHGGLTTERGGRFNSPWGEGKHLRGRTRDQNIPAPARKGLKYATGYLMNLEGVPVGKRKAGEGKTGKTGFLVKKRAMERKKKGRTNLNT